MRKLYTLPSGYVFTLSLILAFFAGLYSLPAAAQSCPTNSTISINSYPNTYYSSGQSIVSAGSTSMVLGAATYGTTPISSGDILVIIQMQGAQINSTNGSGYGDGGSSGAGYLNNGQLTAGNMEYVVASNSVSLGGGTLNIVSGLTRSYQSTAFGTDGQYTYQVIRVPVYFDLQLTGTIAVPRWNGSTGGAIVLYATNTILLNSQTIDASGLGFRGGGGRALSGAGSGSNSDFYTMSSSNANGSKGEGIAGTPKYTNNNSTTSLDIATAEGYPNGSNGMGAPGNAGGGGTDGNPADANDQNTGGGGGGNGGIGGNGGNAWSSGTPSGGKAGALFAQASAARLIMGGGGGAGTTNNATGTPGNGFASSGAAGGGIVILIAGNSITGAGTILANGAAANSSVENDGSGGGGAGGTILIYSNNGITGNITAQAMGGNGASNQIAGGASHGPGGGGGGGVIYSNSTLYGASTVAGGIAGTTTAQSTNYGATNGVSGIMVTNMTQTAPAQVPLHCIVLPVSFLSFTATNRNNATLLNWEVTQAANAKQYNIERSTDGSNFMIIGSTSSTTNQYTDNNLPGTSSTVYYRLQEIDADGASVYSKIISVQLSSQDSDNKLSAYPNPATNSVTVGFTCSNSATVSLRLFDLKGSQLWQQQYSASGGPNTVVIDHIRAIPAGVYILQWFDGLKPEQVKIMVNH